MDKSGKVRAAEGLVMNIGELAQRAGVTRRVVRFYVQRELIPPPQGRGRGSYYTDLHLQRILQIQELQAGGQSLDAIGRLVMQKQMESNDLRDHAPRHIQRRAKAKMLERVEVVSEAYAEMRVETSSETSTETSAGTTRASPAAALAGGELLQRVSVMPGVELSIDVGQFQFNEEEIVQLKRLVVKAVTAVCEK